MIISVASGKGGTGKTLVATSLALSLKDSEKVQLLDCDVEEPDDHVLLRPTIEKSMPVTIPIPEVDQTRCTHCGRCAEVCAYHAIAVIAQEVLVFANLCHGCGACSYLCPAGAIRETEREIGVVESGRAGGIEFVQGRLNVGEAMATPVIRKVKELIDRDGVAIIDCAPGTSCPVVEAVKGSDFCVLVTEPTPFGLNDLALAAGTVHKLGIPCGVVINRAGVGDGKVEDYCHIEGIPVLLTIPMDVKIARLYSEGTALVQGIPRWKAAFAVLFEETQDLLNERDRSLKR